MTPPEEWSPEALALLDSLWGEHASMLVIRRRLLPLLGFYPSPEQVMAMVKVIAMLRRHQPGVAEVIPPRTVFEKIATNRIERFGFGPPVIPDNILRKVAPGTFKARGFTMLRDKS